MTWIKTYLFDMTTEVKPLYLGEARLLKWADSDAAGRTITLQIPEDDGPLHPFKGIPTGKEHGQRMKIVCVAIDDHEQAVDADHARANTKKTRHKARKENGPDPAKASEPDAIKDASPQVRPPVQGQDKPERTPMKRSQIAYLKVREPEFQKWLGAIGVTPDDRTRDADRIIKDTLGVESKSELDIQGPKALAWDRLITDYDMRHTVRS